MGDADRKLFVGKLPGDIREDEMKMIFGTYGRVDSVHILKEGRTNERTGEEERSGFVTFDAPEAARKAIEVLNDVYRFRPHAANPIHCSIARSKASGGSDDRDRGRAGAPHDRYDSGRDQHGGGQGYEQSYDRGYDRTGGGGSGYGSRDTRGKAGGGKTTGAPGCRIYIANLPKDIPQDALDAVFRTYGRVEHIHIMTGKSDKTDQAAAFIVYAESISAKQAVAAMAQGYEIRPGEGNILVKIAEDRSDGGRRKGDDGRDDRYRPY